MWSAKALGLSEDEAKRLTKLFDKPGLRWGDDEDYKVWGNRIKVLVYEAPSKLAQLAEVCRGKSEHESSK